MFVSDLNNLYFLIVYEYILKHNKLESTRGKLFSSIVLSQYLGKTNLNVMDLVLHTVNNTSLNRCILNMVSVHFTTGIIILADDRFGYFYPYKNTLASFSNSLLNKSLSSRTTIFLLRKFGYFN